MKVFEKLDAGRDWAEDEAAVIDTVARLARDEIAPRAAELDRTKARCRSMLAQAEAKLLSAKSRYELQAARLDKSQRQISAARKDP